MLLLTSLSHCMLGSHCGAITFCFTAEKCQQEAAGHREGLEKCKPYEAKRCPGVLQQSTNDAARIEKQLAYRDCQRLTALPATICMCKSSSGLGATYIHFRLASISFT